MYFCLMVGKLRGDILSWYAENGRELPWREEGDAYKIWLSEIILQQTRVRQGLPYYNKFIELFPDVHTMADSSEQDVLKAWQGLGYYSRARNMYHTARVISIHYKGLFPSGYNELIKLKGVGDYTASAIASIAFNKPYAVLDGNVFRVLSRLFAIESPVDAPSSRKVFATIAKDLLCTSKPGTYNQAIMDFGALQCVPGLPDCDRCPLNTSCKAFSLGKVMDYPLKVKIRKIRNRHFHYFLIKNGTDIYLRKRTGADIWKNMYELPLIESGPGELTPGIADTLLKGRDFELLQFTKHVLTHQIIHASFYLVHQELPLNDIEYLPVNLQQLNKFPVPVLIDQFFKNNL